MAFRFTNNVLSTAQQVWLRKLGGAKPVVNENASGIITAGRAKRSDSQPAQPGSRSVRNASYIIIFFYYFFNRALFLTKHKLMINRFKQLREDEKKKTVNKALRDDAQTLASASDSEDRSDDENNDKVKIVLVL